MATFKYGLEAKESLGRVALVLPPSANRLTRWRNNIAYRTREATDWMDYASAQIRRNIRPTTEPVEILIQVREGKGLREDSDLDNFVKVLLDSMKPEKRHKETGQITKPGAGVIQDDKKKYVRRTLREWLPEIKESKTRRGEAEVIVEVFAL